MRVFDGDVKIEPLSVGGLRIIFETSMGERVAAEISSEHVNNFRRAVFLPKGDHLDMSQIKKVTEFLRTDMKEINKTASDLHERAHAAKARVDVLTNAMGGELTDLEKELAELEAELRQNSNNPPEGVA